jgi:hypothetical protein
MEGGRRRLHGRRIIWKAKEKVVRKENNMEGGGEGWTEGE